MRLVGRRLPPSLTRTVLNLPGGTSESPVAATNRGWSSVPPGVATCHHRSELEAIS
jgi:hypothetical protein